jgi:hypothetical protein
MLLHSKFCYGRGSRKPDRWREVGVAQVSSKKLCVTESLSGSQFELGSDSGEYLTVLYFRVTMYLSYGN